MCLVVLSVSRLIACVCVMIGITVCYLVLDFFVVNNVPFDNEREREFMCLELNCRVSRYSCCLKPGLIACVCVCHDWHECVLLFSS